ncbi:MAG: DUF3017 domain-containing protein [Mycobacterium sp.]|nr:DUF3017 domain-containing protein [Mycobacterium sp.]
MKERALEVIRAQWPILTVAAIFVLALVLVAAGFWRRGAFLIGIGVGVAAALRLVLPDDRAGLLVVRARGLDFATMTTISAIMIYTAWTIDPLGTS